MPRTLIPLFFAIVASALAGFVMDGLGVPAGWLLGALLATCLLQSLTGPLRFTKKLRRGGQLVVGSAVAGLITPAVLSQLGDLFVWLLLTAIVTNLFCLGLSMLASSAARIDRRTAALSCLPGGLSEMASLARDMGADDQVVAVFHTIRVTLVVLVVPLLLAFAGFHTVALPGTDAAASTASPWMPLLLAVVSAPVASGASRIGIVNPWVVAPIAIGITAVLLGYQPGPMPASLSIMAQILIGVALGARLDRHRLLAFPRVFAVAVATSSVLIAVTLLAGWGVLAPLLGIPVGTGVVSMAPGGMAEMLAVSKAMDLMPTTVASFAIVRSVFTNTIVSQLVSRIPANAPTSGR